MLKAVSIKELKPGMYVDSVTKQRGRMQVKSKGIVKDDAAINALKEKGVLILSVDLSKSKLEQEKETSVKKPVQKRKTLSEQMTAAESLFNQAKVIQRDFVKKIKEDQRADLDSMMDLSLDIVDSVIDSPNALSCLALLNRSDEYFMEHSLNCSTLMAMFARHLDLDGETVEALSLAGLLMDVGMVNIPQDITHKRGELSKTEFDVVTTHVDIGVDIIERCGDVSDIVRSVIFNHHERVDGSGYPSQKSGDDVDLYMRMAGIIDSYDAMTTDRPYSPAVPATSALKALLVDPQYDSVLVQKFIQCLGVHPVGSLVKLTNQRLGIVVKANKTNPLSPKVITLYHLKSGTYSETKIVDLSKVQDEIENSVRPEEFGINLTKFFRDIFMSNFR